MECRIELNSEVLPAMLKITGRLAGQAIGQLLELRRSVLGVVTLDLTDLATIDNEGVEVIKAMSLGGDEIRNASPFVQLLLQPDPRG